MSVQRVFPASQGANPPDPGEQPGLQTPPAKPHSQAIRLDPARILAWLIPFAVVVYLGMRKGGFEEQIRGPVGVLLWVLIGAGLAAWALPRARISRLGWIGFGLIVAYAAWTTIGISWSSSSGRSLTEAARNATYAGAFLAALLIGGRERLRSVAGAVGAACAVVAAMALLSRLHPGWFPDFASPEGAENRLDYPFGYWNALAAFVALGTPLVVWAATAARSLTLRGLAAAALPTMALAIYFTYSRAGVITAVIGVLAYIALSRRRLALLPPIAVMAALSGLAVWQGSRRDALGDALDNSLAHSQGNEMLAIALVAGAIAGVVVAVLAWAERTELVRQPPEVPRRTSLIALAAVVVIGLVGFVGAGGIGKASDRFDEFKEPAALGSGSARFTSSGGNGRWQYWTSAVDAFETEPVHGIGPGTFQFWWYENRDVPAAIKQAHSLYIETLAEMGIVGLLLILSFVVLVLVVGVTRSLRALGERRGMLAALTASALTFALSAGFDWLWEFGALAIAFMFVSAAILATRDDDEDGEVVEASADAPAEAEGSRDGEDAPAEAEGSRGLDPRLGLALRIGGAVASFAIAAFILVPAQSAQDLSDSRNAFADDLQTALTKAEDAAELTPYAALPRYQEAYVYEANGELARAAQAAREATEREPDNWETWYLLARIQAQREGKEGSALIALRRARELNRLDTTINPVNCNRPGNPCQIGEQLGGVE